MVKKKEAKKGKRMIRKEETELSKNYQEAKELIKDKAYLFDAMMGAIGDLVTIQDIDMRIVYQNEAIKKLFGAHEGEFCYTIYERKDKICEGCMMQKSFKDGGVHKDIRVGIPLNGTSRRFENVAAVLKNKQGKIVAGIEIVRNVEEREKDKEELQKKIGELEEFGKIAVERELEMKRLEEKLEKLKGK